MAATAALIAATACGCGLTPRGQVGPTASPSSSPQAGALATPCPTGPLLPNGQAVMIDHINFVMLKDVMFVADLGGPVTATGPLGPVVARVRCSLMNAPKNRLDPPLVDGTASFLPVGTEILEVPGFAPTCRVAATVNGAVHVYLAQTEVNGRSQATACAVAPTPGQAPS